MENNRFDSPQRQSTIGVLIMFADSLQKFGRAFFPLILVFIVKNGSTNKYWLLLALLLLFVVTAVIAYLRFINFTFFVDDEAEEFIINEGVFNKSQTTVSLSKIQQVTISQSLIQRIIGVYGLDIDSAGSEKKEGKIKAVSHELALALKARLLENTGKVLTESSEETVVNTAQTPDLAQQPFLKINLSSLFKVGITSNYLRSIGLILTFFFTLQENLRNIGRDELINEDKITSIVDNYPLIYSVLVFILFMFTVVFVINISRTLIKYFGYTVALQKGSLLLSYGLINTKSTILKPEKVQIVSVSRNFFQKKLNVLEIKIKQTTTDTAKQNQSVVEVPGCNTAEKDEILKLIFKQIPKKGVMMKPNFRRLVFGLFLKVALPVGLYYWLLSISKGNLDQVEHFVWFYAIVMTLITLLAFRNYRLFINENHIIKQSGAWDVANEIIEIKKIQAIATSQLFWHKNLNIGTLTLFTSGGKIVFDLGNFDTINDLANRWLYELETSNSNWM